MSCGWMPEITNSKEEGRMELGRNLRIVGTLAAAAWLVLTLSGCPAGLPFGANMIVHAGESLQEAIAQASPGMTIYVTLGTYPEDVIIDKDGITLIGQSGAKIDGDLTVNADDVTINNFEVTGVLETTPGSFANLSLINVVIWGVTLNVTLSCDAVVNPAETIQSHIDAAASGETICVAPGTYDGFDADKDGITVAGIAGSGPVISGTGTTVDGQVVGILVSAHNVTIEGFTVTGAYSTGIYIYDSTTPPQGATIKDNTVDQSGFDPFALPGVTWDPAGIRAKAGGSPPTVITGNTVEFGPSATKAQNGIDVFGYHNADYQILDNTVTINVGPGPTYKYKVGINTHEISGIGGPYTSTALIKGNTVTSPDNTDPCTWTKVFGIGAWGEPQGNITIEDNVVTKTTYALWVGQVETDYIVVTGNDFKNNGFGVVVEDGAGAKLAIHSNNIEGNCFGIYNEDGNPAVNAENNWWGDADGPEDPADDAGETTEVPPCTGTPSSEKNTDPAGSLGNKVSDTSTGVVDYCPWSNTQF